MWTRGQGCLKSSSRYHVFVYRFFFFSHNNMAALISESGFYQIRILTYHQYSTNKRGPVNPSARERRQRRLLKTQEEEEETRLSLAAPRRPLPGPLALSPSRQRPDGRAHHHCRITTSSAQASVKTAKQGRREMKEGFNCGESWRPRRGSGAQRGEGRGERARGEGRGARIGRDSLSAASHIADLSPADVVCPPSLFISLLWTGRINTARLSLLPAPQSLIHYGVCLRPGLLLLLLRPPRPFLFPHLSLRLSFLFFPYPKTPSLPPPLPLSLLQPPPSPLPLPLSQPSPLLIILSSFSLRLTLFLFPHPSFPLFFLPLHVPLF